MSSYHLSRIYWTPCEGLSCGVLKCCVRGIGGDCVVCERQTSGCGPFS